MSWPKRLEDIEQIFKVLGLGEWSSTKVAAAVQQMSDFYIAHPESPTPWKERWAQVAQLGYYLPLNLLRAERVHAEARRWNFLELFDSVFDFGSGLGAGSWPILWDESRRASWKSFLFCERSAPATQLHRDLLNLWLPHEKRARWTDAVGPQAGGTRSLLLMSYSWTEMNDWPSWAAAFGGVMILEPSTRQDGRKLMELRKKLLAEGYKIWAPCTHQEACPLLEKSQNDWCHDRLRVEAPAWFWEVDRRLPFKNQTLTFSYLLATRESSPPTEPGVARTVGDALPEKGKTRQLICRGPEREFLAWMHRDGEPASYPRGELITLPQDLKAVANELRVPPTSKPGP